MKQLRSLITNLKKLIPKYLVGIFALMVTNFIQMILPKIIGEVFDRLKTKSINYSDLLTFSLYILIIGLIIFLGRIIFRAFIFGASRDVEYNLRNQLFKHLEKLSLNFYNKNKTGNLLTHFTNDLEAVRLAIGPGIVMAIDGIFSTILIITSMLIFVNVRLTLVAILPLPIIAFGGIIFGKSIITRFTNKQIAYGKLSEYVQETFTGIRAIKAFVQEKNEIKAFLKINQNNMDKNIKLIKLFGILLPIGEIISGISFIISLSYGGYLTTIGKITLGQFVMFNEFIGMLIWPMFEFGLCVIFLSRGYSSQIRIQNILNEKPDIFDRDNIHDVKLSKAKIEIKKLNFAYDKNNKKALDNINIIIEPGKTFAIIGKTGSGKSTLVNLLLRLYNPPEKSIFIDGMDIFDIPFKTLRNFVGIVPQENFLFSDSITGNIGLGVDDLIFDEIVQSAKNANIYNNIIDFPNKFKTIIGERGITLSGGQKQRISISRVLLKNTPILILDDSLSSVDTLTEETILNNLYSLRKNKTTIIIAHRISTVKSADKIIVLDNGRIIEQGTHNELLAKKGKYSEMYYRQMLEKKIEESLDML